MEMTKSRKQAWIKLGVLISLYLGAVWFLTWFVPQYPNSRWSFAAAGLPIMMIGITLVFMMSSFRDMDEMQARMHLEALAFAFMGTLLLASGYSFLAFAGIFTLPAQLFVPVMVLMWAFGMLLSVRKYR